MSSPHIVTLYNMVRILEHSAGGYRDLARLLAELYWQPKWGAIRENNSRKSRNSCLVNGSGVGAHGQLSQGANWRNLKTNYKHSKNVFSVTSIALSLGHIWAGLLELPAQSLIGSPGTLLSSTFKGVSTEKHLSKSWIGWGWSFSPTIMTTHSLWLLLNSGCEVTAAWQVKSRRCWADGVK